jgi:predicted protein tyrosine phosphatase
MKIFVCPRDWTYATERFKPDHMISLQNPGADISDLRPAWVRPENHYVEYFFDIDDLKDSEAPTERHVKGIIEWLLPRCHSHSEVQLLIHCDAGLGRSPAIAYIAWSIFLGAGREQEAFEHLKKSCLESRITPNTTIVAHADRILQRHGALIKPVTEWNRTISWGRTFR